MFADIIKIVTMFIETILKNSIKVLKNWKFFIQMPSISVFHDIAKFADFQRKNANVS